MVMYSVEGWLAPGAPLSMSLFAPVLGDLSQWRVEPELHIQYPDDSPEEALERLIGDKKFFAGDRGGAIHLVGPGKRRFNTFLASSGRGRVKSQPVELVAAELDRLASLTYFMSAALLIDADDVANANRRSIYYRPNQRFALPGVAPLTWFGEPLVSWFGGDSVFEGLPDGWAVRTEFGQWRVVGLDRVENPEGFQWESWSKREAAVIEALGREFFFDPVSGWIPDEDPPVLELAPYPVHRWIDGGLVVQEPDGSTRPAALDGERLRFEPVQVDGRAFLANQAALFEEEFRGMGFGEHLDDAPLSWVEVWAEGQTYFEHRSGVELIGAWFGQQFVGAIDAVVWEETDAGWRLRSGSSLFDPFDLAEGLMQRRAGMSVGLFMAAIRAAGL